jgi:hypothetical protein
MRGPLYLQIVDGLGLLIFFVVNPILFVGIGYAAWKGKPTAFDQKKYATLGVGTFLFGAALLLLAKWINADIRTWPYAVQAPCMIIGLLLIGFGCGCVVGFIVLFGKAQLRHSD